MKWSLLSIYQRFNLGLTLALAAWLMQLSVFLTPIFSQQIGIGHGICDELSVLVPANATSASSALHSSLHPMPAAMAGMDMAGMDMHSMGDMPSMSAGASSQAPVPQHSSDHQNHALCGFCLLFGHSVLPPSFSLDTLFAQRAILLRAMFLASDYRQFIPRNKTLRPQGRAPPFDFIAVR